MREPIKLCVMVSIIAAGAAAALQDMWHKIDEPVGVTIIANTPQSPELSFSSSSGHYKVSLNDLDALKTPPKEHEHFYSSSAKTGSGDPKDTLYAISAFYGLPKELLYAQYLKETHGDCSATSGKQAVGCFQFLSSTAKQFGLIGHKHGRNFDYRHSLPASGDAAARYLLWLAHVMYGEQTNLSDWSQLTHVLAAYNAGLSRVFREGRQPRVPSFFETQNYVHDIVRLANGESYFVSDGETLADVSVKVEVSEQELLQGNPHLKTPDGVHHGMILSVPDQLTKESEMMVRPKMSLSQISNGTGIPIREIMKANDLSGPTLKTGMVLKLPVDKSILTP